MQRVQNAINEAQVFFRTHPAELLVIEANGVELAAKRYPRENPKGRIILFHGYRSIAETDFACAMEAYYNLGYELVLVDQRAGGKSSGNWIAKRLDAMGYEIWATRGTSTALWRAGVESNALYKIPLGSPNTIDLIKRGKVKWIVNTREDGESAAHDSVKIRAAAVAAGVPVTTTLAGFAEAVSGLEAIRRESGAAPLSLQEWHANQR